MKPLLQNPRAALIDTEAVERNVRLFAQLAAPASLMAVIKADAYGHGALRTARAALRAGVGRFGVALVSEALLLRKELGAGPTILAWLHGAGTDFPAALRAEIELGTNGSELEEIIAAAQSTGKTPRLHLKVDTGLGRNGALEDGWDELFSRAAAAQQAGYVRVVGLMTHLAVADEPSRPETDAQKAAFERAVSLAEQHGLTGLIRHCANTPATITRSDLHFDMVRVGLGLYGLLPFAPEEIRSGAVRIPAELDQLRPAMTLQAPVALVKRAQKGQGVSYGLSYVLDEPRWLGLIPLGYADGIPRVSQGAHVRIAGKQYPVVGRIAMDQMVVDLGTHESAAGLLGEIATVFGAFPEGPTAETWAASSGTINYEIVTRISQRVERREIRRFEAQTVEQTHAAARRLAEQLRAGDVVVLSGPLGAGKTTFTQGLAAGLGADGPVSSPTFVLAREHPGTGGRPGLVHVDAYRLTTAVGGSRVDHTQGQAPEGSVDLGELGLDPALGHSVIVVEWGETVDPSWGRRTFLVTLERELTASAGTTEDGGLDFDDEEAADPRVITWEQITGETSPSQSTDREQA